jgi:hypothetical protein
MDTLCYEFGIRCGIRGGSLLFSESGPPILHILSESEMDVSNMESNLHIWGNSI